MPRPADRAAPRALGPRAARSRLAGAALVAPLLLAGCGTDGEADTAAPEVSATTASAEPSPSASETPTPTPDDAKTVTITVAGGEVTGAEARTPVEVGERVRLTITSDAPDEIHVHGYDITRALPAGQPVNVEFVADQPGIFAVELHDSRLVLTRLQVQ
ncbi:MAG: hypothetical protein ACLGIG_00080 [Actinomycetes bacterium]